MPLGVLELVCLALYLLPQTAVFGALLWTGYLGGAVASHVRIGNPMLTHVLFPIYVATLLWLGLWLRDARLNGRIPGGHIARLGGKVKEFVRANTGDKSGDPYAKKMEPLESRMDGARDWEAAEASALLNDIAAVSDAPLSVMLEETAGRAIQHGPPLRAEASWEDAWRRAEIPAANGQGNARSVATVQTVCVAVALSSSSTVRR